MSEQRLYPRQQVAVDQWTKLPYPKRRLWVWDTGCGKTPSSCVVAREYNRILIVCPAIVRRHWYREVRKWTGRNDVAVIELGRERILSKTASLKRDRSFLAPVQIVSYDLLSEVAVRGWELIIIDEAHHLANAHSRQACLIEQLIQDNPHVDILGLTATLIPTEAAQVWNPMRLLFGWQKWGKPATRGKDRTNWNFRMRYCHVERTEYGMQTYGCRDDRRNELRRRMQPHINVLHREDIIGDLPPLDLQLLELAAIQGVTAPDHRFETDNILLPTQACTLVTWAEQMADSVNRIVILVHHRSLVEEVRRQLLTKSLPLKDHEVRVVTGAMNAASRFKQLEVCGGMEKVVLVGTHDSVCEGVRMMWAEQVIIDEWSRSPGRVLQVLGRFQAVNSKRRPCVRLRTTADNYCDAELLLERVKVVQDVLGSGKATKQLADVLGKSGPSPDDVAASWLDMLDSQRSDEVVEERAQVQA